MYIYMTRLIHTHARKHAHTLKIKLAEFGDDHKTRFSLHLQPALSQSDESTPVQPATQARPVGDDREGYIDHPTRGRLDTYIFEVCLIQSLS